MKAKILIIILIIIVIAAFAFAIFSQSSQEKEGLLSPPYKELTDFNLIDDENHPFTLATLKGKWSFLFFGYTHCPDVCPTTLYILSGVKAQLLEHKEETRDTQYIFISVDRERDNPEKLSTYVKFFDSELMAATGTETQVNELTKQLGIVYLRKPGKTKNDYLIDHSSSILLINPEGKLIGKFSAPHIAEKIVSLYLKIRHLSQ